jgi:oxygen-independent coproporphyrinogen-3 oxidase
MNGDSTKFENYRLNSVYIHIPFCRKKCSYCDFYSHVPVSESEIDDYVEILLREFMIWKEWIDAKEIKTVYVGGGTPSILNPSWIERIINEWNSSNTVEITVEGNPESINEDLLKSLHFSGANRISIGIQSFKDEFLKILGRVHSSADAKRALEMVKKYPFSLSIDLIYGIPGQNIEDFIYDLNSAMDFSPQHLSAYILQPSEKTEMKKLMKDVDEEKVAEKFLLLCQFMKEKGFNHYEISNFAIPGQECIHNFNYWNNGFYAGCGISSASHLPSKFFGKNPVRTRNFVSMKSYTESIKKGLFPFEEIEEITPENEIKEILMLGLRTSRGVKISSIEDFLGVEKTKDFLKEATSLGLEIDEGYLKFKEENWLLFNSIVSRLFYQLEVLKNP